MSDADKVVDMLRENPRSLKELAQALNTSKEHAASVVNTLSSLVETQRSTRFNGRSKPVVIVQYSLKNGA